MAVVVVVASGVRVEQERPAVVPEVIPPRYRKKRRKGSKEPMARPTTVMLPAVVVAVLVEWVLGGFGERMVMAMPPLPHPVATEARVSATPFQEQRSTTVAVAVVEPTTIQDLRQHPVVREVSVAVELAPVQTGVRVQQGQQIPVVVVAGGIRRDWVEPADPVW